MNLTIGMRVALKHDVERYPHFIAPKGARGTVVDTGIDPLLSGTVLVRLDETLEGAEEWDNCVQWLLSEDGDLDDVLEPLVEVSPAEAEALFAVLRDPEMFVMTSDDPEESEGGWITPSDWEVLEPLVGRLQHALPVAAPEPRTIVVNLAVKVPADDPRSAADVITEVERVLDEQQISFDTVEAGEQWEVS